MKRLQDHNQHGEDVQHPMQVQSCDASIKRFPQRSHKDTLISTGDCGPVDQETWRHRRGNFDHFTVHHQGTIWGKKGPHRIELGVGVKAHKRLNYLESKADAKHS